VRSVEPACPGRRRSAPGLGTWRRSARSASPHHTARCCHRGCRSPGRRRGDAWQGGPFDHGITAALRRERCGPVVTRPCRAPCGAPDAGRDPSIEGVQPSCQRSAPGIRIDAPSLARVDVAVHAASPASTRGAPATQAFSAGGAFAQRASGAPGFLTGPALQRQPPRGPHAAVSTRRVNGEHELADEERLPPTRRARKRSRTRVTARAAVPVRRLAEAARLGAFERARPRPRPSVGHRTLRADFCHRRETRAHPRGDRYPARPVVAHGTVAPEPEPAGGEHGNATPTSRAQSRSTCMAARRPRKIRARAPSSRARLAASVGAPLRTVLTKAAAARPRERANRGRGRGAFRS
jgi:hypothetical protein